MIAVGNDIGDKINQELRSLGANLVVTPIEDTLDVNIGGVNLKPASEGAFINEQTWSRSRASSGDTTSKAMRHFLSDRQKIQTRSGEFHAELIGTYFASRCATAKSNSPLAFAPSIPGGRCQGSWPQDYGDFPEQLPPDVLAGSKLAHKPGSISAMRLRSAAASCASAAS